MYFTLAKMIWSFIFLKPRPIIELLKLHFGRSPAKFPIISATFKQYRQPCISQAFRAYAQSVNRKCVLVGISTYDASLRFSDLMHPDRSEQQREGPVRFGDFTLDGGQSLSFAAQGLYLIKDKDQKLAVFITDGGRFDEDVLIEVISKDRAASRRFLSELRTLIDQKSIYKGKVISITENRHEPPQITFHDVPKIDKAHLILPQQIIEQIEKHTSYFSEHRDLLRSRGLHLKRGLLLYGPPGTGKTLAMMHVISTMPERTTILLKAASISQLDNACALAKSLHPATVIDDVDLIAEDRTRGSQTTVLFELLNHMDGIGEDSDILFLLGTNRPEALEPALVSRPGCVDQALLIPLPDGDCRRRLFNHYSKHVPLAFDDSQKFVDSTEGASAAFIRELIRNAVLIAAEEGEDVLLDESHFDRALGTLKSGGALIDKLLAFDGGPPLGETA